MLDQNAQDAKQDSGINTEVGTSSIPDVQKIDPENNRIVSTVEGVDEPGVESAAVKADAAKSDDEKEDKADKAKGQEARYDKDPAWQRIMKERDEAMTKAARAEAEADLLKAGYKPPAEKTEEQVPFKDIAKMSKEELIEWMEEDPHGYADNLKAMARWEGEQVLRTRAEEAQRATITHSIEETFTSYAKENQSFDKMWESGEIKKYMDEHPGHNAISAHMILTKGSEVEERVKAAKAEAIKETEARMLANQKAKRNATVLDGGPGAGTQPDADSVLNDTKSSGGLTSVLADRLRALRQGKAS